MRGFLLNLRSSVGPALGIRLWLIELKTTLSFLSAVVTHSVLELLDPAQLSLSSNSVSYKKVCR
jgi:hypothetical protein